VPTLTRNWPGDKCLCPAGEVRVQITYACQIMSATVRFAGTNGTTCSV